jgi:Uma2 family endonuclease
MVATLERPMQQMVLPGITWETFERILDEVGERHFRLAYLNGEMEYMTISFEHNSYGEWMSRLIYLVASVLETNLCSGGSTTLKATLAQAALEPDRCFWIKNAGRMRNKKKWNSASDPPPDLSVEIDITSSWLDRLEIYASLKVPEVWRFDGDTLKVLALTAGGKYKERSKSMAFPQLPMDGFVRFIKKLGSVDEIPLGKEFSEWLRSCIAGKKSSSERKNGRRPH